MRRSYVTFRIFRAVSRVEASPQELAAYLGELAKNPCRTRSSCFGQEFVLRQARLTPTGMSSCRPVWLSKMSYMMDIKISRAGCQGSQGIYLGFILRR